MKILGISQLAVAEAFVLGERLGLSRRTEAFERMLNARQHELLGADD